MTISNSTAAYLDAAVAAHQAGVPDAEVALMTEIGEDIARFAEGLHHKFASLTSGAAGSANGSAGGASKIAGPPSASYVMDEPDSIVEMIVQYFDEDAYGYSLDHADVIKAAAALHLERTTAFAVAA